LQHQLETDYPHRLTKMNIPALSREESEEFIDQFLGQKHFIPETRKLVVKKCEGNPYFIRSSSFSLIARALLQPMQRAESGNKPDR
jgi:predicted ATPase